MGTSTLINKTLDFYNEVQSSLIYKSKTFKFEKDKNGNLPLKPKNIDSDMWSIVTAHLKFANNYSLTINNQVNEIAPNNKEKWALMLNDLINEIKLLDEAYQKARNSLQEWREEEEILKNKSYARINDIEKEEEDINAKSDELKIVINSYEKQVDDYNEESRKLKEEYDRLTKWYNEEINKWYFYLKIGYNIYCATKYNNAVDEYNRNLSKLNIAGSELSKYREKFDNNKDYLNDLNSKKLKLFDEYTALQSKCNYINAQITLFSTSIFIFSNMSISLCQMKSNLENEDFDSWDDLFNLVKSNLKEIRKDHENLQKQVESMYSLLDDNDDQRLSKILSPLDLAKG